MPYTYQYTDLIATARFWNTFTISKAYMLYNVPLFMYVESVRVLSIMMTMTMMMRAREKLPIFCGQVLHRFFYTFFYVFASIHSIMIIVFVKLNSWKSVKSPEEPSKFTNLQNTQPNQVDPFIFIRVLTSLKPSSVGRTPVFHK